MQIHMCKLKKVQNRREQVRGKHKQESKWKCRNKYVGD